MGRSPTTRPRVNQQLDKLVRARYLLDQDRASIVTSLEAAYQAAA
jgi:hypothetical protein